MQQEQQNSSASSSSSSSSSNSAFASVSVDAVASAYAVVGQDKKDKKKTFSLDQERAIRQFVIASKNMYLGGEGGTGKSTLIHHIIKLTRNKWPKDELAVGVTATSSQ